MLDTMQGVLGLFSIVFPLLGLFLIYFEHVSGNKKSAVFRIAIICYVIVILGVVGLLNNEDKGSDTKELSYRIIDMSTIDRKSDTIMGCLMTVINNYEEIEVLKGVKMSPTTMDDCMQLIAEKAKLKQKYEQDYPMPNLNTNRGK